MSVISRTMTSTCVCLLIQVCDRILDCPEGDDEEYCDYKDDNNQKQLYFKHYIPTHNTCQSLMTEYPALVNDLYPDCDDASDEIMIRDGMRTTNETSYCSDYDSSPCHIGTSFRCYERTDTCVYREDILGLLSPCRNAGHLKSCWFHECPTMFKCRESYCLPYELVCDGVAQCPSGEDEYRCTFNSDRVCPGLFRCKHTQTCIHITQLCDGTVNCPVLGEDEKLCRPCPTECSCSGLNYNCSNSQLNRVPIFSRYAAVILISHNNISRLILKDCNYLIKLDISSNKIQYLTIGGFIECSNMKILDIHSNYINHLRRGYFRGLRQLIELNIANNPIRVLFKHCWDGLASLPKLTLDARFVENIPDCLFADLTSLKILEIRNTKINYLSHSMLCTSTTITDIILINNTIKYMYENPFMYLLELTNITTNQHFICCSIISRDIDCITESDTRMSCRNLIGYVSFRIFLFVAGISIVIIAFASTLFWITQKPKKKLLSFIIWINLFDSIMGFYMLMISTAIQYFMHMSVSWSLEYWHTTWFCRSAMFSAQVSMETSLWLNMINSIDQLLLTKYAHTLINLSRFSLNLMYTFGLCIAVGLTSVNLYMAVEEYTGSEMCSFIIPGGNSSNIQWIMWVYHIFLLILFIVTNSCMIHFFLTRNQPQMKKTAFQKQKETYLIGRSRFSISSKTIVSLIFLIIQLVIQVGLNLDTSLLTLLHMLTFVVNVLVNFITHTFTSSIFLRSVHKKFIK